ncbi:unnamed protein product [Calypogeia fissa]
MTEKKLEDGDLSLAKLYGELASKLVTIHDHTIETIMVMTTSRKEKFQNVIKSLTNESVKFDKPPFVALLERKETDSPWEQVCSLEKNAWDLILSSGKGEDLQEHVAKKSRFSWPSMKGSVDASPPLVALQSRL